MNRAMRSKGRGVVGLVLMLSLAAFAALPTETAAWGNGDPGSVEFTDFGVHDITNDIALRTATYLAPDEVEWINDWYTRNETDHGHSFDPASTAPTPTDNFNAYTDDPDSHWQDWENHTLYLHPRPGWPPAEGDAARRVSHLYNLTRDRLYAWLMNGSVRWDSDEHHAAYYAGLMSHYVMDITQFGHTDWTRLDHSHPGDDPRGATYHGYYEALTWTDTALRRLHVDLMSNPLPEAKRVSDPYQLVYDLAGYVNGRHGPPVLFTDSDSTVVTLGSTYVRMLTNFTANWDANLSHNDARGYDEELWNMTLENLLAGMTNLTHLWRSAYLDARDMFLKDAADLVVTNLRIDPPDRAYDGQRVMLETHVWNRGSADADPFDLVLYVDGSETNRHRISVLSGTVRTLGWYWTAEAGVHEFRVVADDLQEVPESNETNNILVSDYTVVEEFHGSMFTAESPYLELLQDDTGHFNLTLENLGNRDDVYRFRIIALPGTIDYSVTLPLEEVHLEGGANVSFRVDVATLLSNPPGPRTFTVVAEGGNSSISTTLTVIIGERQLAPYIVVDYPFYGNVSVPVTFDASASWDHNGDPITFEWDFGDNTTGTGEVVEHVYDEVGNYVIVVNATDGTLNRTETLEVSVQDALPPKPVLWVEDYDVDTLVFEWTPWLDSRYFRSYRLYMVEMNSTWPSLTVPDSDDIALPENLVWTSDLSYVSGTQITNESIIHGFAVLETESIYGARSLSAVVQGYMLYRLESYEWPDPLEVLDIYIVNTSKNSIEVRWREWRPLVDEGHYYLSITPRDEWEGVRVYDLTRNTYNFTGLVPGTDYRIHVTYTANEGRTQMSNHVRGRTVLNLPPTIQIAPRAMSVLGDAFVLHMVLDDPDGSVVNVSVNWGDGTGWWFYDPETGHIAPSHVFPRRGAYTVTVTVLDDDGAEVNATSEVEVTWPQSEGDGADAVSMGTFLLLLIITFVLLVGAIQLANSRRRALEREEREREAAIKAPPYASELPGDGRPPVEEDEEPVEDEEASAWEEGAL